MKKICLYCHKEFETHTRTNYCCEDHKRIHRNLLTYPDGSEYVECQICSYRGQDLHHHIKHYHKMTIDDYCSTYNIKLINLQTAELRKHNSDMQKLAVKEGKIPTWGKGDANPSRRKEVKDGRKSIFSMNYEGYDGLTDQQKRETINSLFHDLAQKKQEDNNNPLTIEYYIKRGFSKKEAKKLLADRQNTFSLEKCIKKHGVEKGTQIFKDRQKRWQQSLNSKPVEEIERINKSKFSQNNKGWSKISQELFMELEKQISSEYSQIFYATNNKNVKNNEYMVYDDKTFSTFFLDFYIKDNNKVIEFDGDYWHGEKRGNQERDRIREQKLNKLGYTNILHVAERAYNKNRDEVILQCLEFIRK